MFMCHSTNQACHIDTYTRNKNMIPIIQPIISVLTNKKIELPEIQKPLFLVLTFNNAHRYTYKHR